MQLAPAARAGLVLDVDDLRNPQRVRGQRLTVSAAFSGLVGMLDGINRFLAREALGLLGLL